MSKCAPEPKLQGISMKCLNPLNFFFTVWPIGEGGLGSGRVSKCALNQSCRKFDEML